MVSVAIQSKFSEDIFKLLTAKLTESQLMIISPDTVARMNPLKGVSITIDDLLLNWTSSCYQSIQQTLKNSLETEGWTAIDPEERVADIFQFVRFLDMPFEESLSFFTVKKSLVTGTEKYLISRSFVNLVEALHSFMQLIFKKKIATYHLATKMIELVLVGRS